MPIVAGDLNNRYSGGAGNSDPNASLGGAISTTEITTATLGNHFDQVGSAEATAGSVKYRCRYIQNNHGTLTWENVVIWISAQTPSSDTSYDIGLGSSGLNGTEQTVADEDTAPVGVTFSAPANKGSGLAIGNIPPGQHYPIWVRRTVNPGAAAIAIDNAITTIEGDTQA